MEDRGHLLKEEEEVEEKKRRRRWCLDQGLRMNSAVMTREKKKRSEKVTLLLSVSDVEILIKAGLCPKLRNSVIFFDGKLFASL